MELHENLLDLGLHEALLVNQLLCQPEIVSHLTSFDVEELETIEYEIQTCC